MLYYNNNNPSNDMIPKTIHYCWFGKTKKSNEILRCIDSWKKMCPDFSIVEWNEGNFPIDQFPFTKRMYSEKKWAFVADYARLHTLLEHGGFYLDTDMLLVQSLEQLTNFDCVLGEESKGIISAGMIGSSSSHPFIQECKNYYDSHTDDLVTIPRVLTDIYNNYSNKQSIKVYSPETFYPFDSERIKEYKGQYLGENVIGVHLWNYSWGHPVLRLLNKIPLYHSFKRLLDKLGIKKTIKKILGLART